MSAILSLFGGAAFRAIWGEVSTWLNNRQQHSQELERMKLQSELDAARSTQQLDALKTQSELGIKTIEVQKDAAMSQADADAFTAGLKAAAAATGVAWVDAWNGVVRPSYATVVLGLWIGVLWTEHFHPSEWDLSVMGSVIGFFFADRALRHAGK